MIIAVDFDDTLYIGNKPNTMLFETLKARQRAGDIIILNTCRAGVRLNEAVAFAEKNGLRFNAVNDNIPPVIKMLGFNPRKIFADIYIDDKAVKP